MAGESRSPLPRTPGRENGLVRASKRPARLRSVAEYIAGLTTTAWDKARSAVAAVGKLRLSYKASTPMEEPRAYSDEAGRGYRSEAGRCSDVKPATIPI